MIKHAIKNGEIIEEKDALVNVLDPAFQSNYSVYEALRVINGHIIKLDDHIKRLEESGIIIGLPIPPLDWEKLINTLLECDKIKDATLRIVYFGSKQRLFYITWSKLLTYPDSYYLNGVDTILYFGERFLPQAKTSNLLVSYLARKKAEESGAFEALLIDRKDRILEGSRSNFYAVKNDTLYTSPDNLVLDGITRNSVIRAFEEEGFSIIYEPPLVKDITTFDTLLISSTSMGAMMIKSVNGREVKKDYSLVSRINKSVREWEENNA